MKRIFIAIALLFTVAALVRGLHLFSSEPGSEKPLVTAPQRVPDAVARNTESANYNELGQLSWKLNAEQVVFYRNPDHSEFQQPRAQVFLEDDPVPWRIRAERGELENKDQVHLHQDVVIMTRSPQATVQRIDTEYMLIDLTNNVLRSDQPLVLTGPGLRIEANGLYAELDNERIQLTNGVRSVYEPQP